MSNINIVGRHIEVSEPIKAYVHKKLGRLENYFESITQVHVILRIEKTAQIAEATVHAKGHHELFAQSEGADLYSAIDLLSDKLYRQIQKIKEKMQQ